MSLIQERIIYPLGAVKGQVFRIHTESAKDLMLITGLLSMVDRPLEDSVDWEDAGIDDISNMSIEQHEKITGILDDYDSIYHAIIRRTDTREPDNFRDIKEKLEEKIKGLPFRKITDPKEGHRQVFSAVMQELINEFKSERNIQNPRVLSLWLLMLALEMDCGEISPNKFAFIDEFRNHFDIEDDVFEDLQERAASLRKELEKTMSIIIE